jgi:hypothetical protein
VEHEQRVVDQVHGRVLRLRHLPRVPQQHLLGSML